MKYQVLPDLRSLSRLMQEGKASFRFQAIPQAFASIRSSRFDPTHAKAQFACGVEVGRAGKWSTDVPTTPIMVLSDPSNSPKDAKTPTEKACQS